MNPDNMLAGGLKSDFDGLITKVRVVPWDYNGNLDHHVLAVAVTIKPDDEPEEFTQHYSAGDLENFAPSKDGENPVPLDKKDAEPEELEGVYALKVGKKDGLSNSSNWAQFITAALDAGFKRESLAAAVTCFEGVYGHFDRIPQKKRSGLVRATPAAGDKARNNDVLVITEIKEAPATKGAAAAKTAAPKSPSASSKPAAASTSPAAPTGAGGDLDAKLVEVVRGALKAAGDDGLHKSKLPAAALKSLAAADKGKGVKRIVDGEFLAGNEAVWVYDADSGTLISVEG